MKTNKTPSSSNGPDIQREVIKLDWEVSYLSQKLNESEKDVEDAIRHVGHSRDKVEEFFGNKKKNR